MVVVNRGKEGKKSSNLYVVNLSPNPPEKPISSAGVAHLSSAGDAHACAGAAHLSSAGAAHRTSHSLEPVIEPKKNTIKKSEPVFVGWPSIPSPDVWADYKKLRQAKKAPVTDTVLAAMAGELKKLAAHRVGVDQALRVCCERGWQGLKCEWVLNHLGLAGAGGGQRPGQFVSARERDAQHFADALDYDKATKF
ncbi:hypothetical protein [uncultured Gilvimarinus sp.]|uniref:hypothetical protein n=1 Tax=uncultured Gilvimarinus sp. TaxID=1689143 RepID=UPI0030D95C1B